MTIQICHRATLIVDYEVLYDLRASLRARNSEAIERLMERWRSHIDAPPWWVGYTENGIEISEWRYTEDDFELTEWCYREVSGHVREGRFEHALCLLGERYLRPIPRSSTNTRSVA